VFIVYFCIFLINDRQQQLSFTTNIFSIFPLKKHFMNNKIVRPCEFTLGHGRLEIVI